MFSFSILFNQNNRQFVKFRFLILRDDYSSFFLVRITDKDNLPDFNSFKLIYDRSLSGSIPNTDPKFYQG